MTGWRILAQCRIPSASPCAPLGVYPNLSASISKQWNGGRPGFIQEERRTMNPKLLALAALALIVTACVPITSTQESSEPAAQEAAEAKAGLSDLASFFAKADEADDPGKYTALIYEIERCLHPNLTEKEMIEGVRDGDTWVSPGEIVATTIYSVGLFTAFGPQEQDYPDDSNEELSMYELLELALASCMEGP